MSQLALQLIAQEKQARTGYLDLGRCGLTELPKELFDCTWLHTLIVSNSWWDYEKKEWQTTQNKGTYNILRGTLPDDFKRLTQLKTLKIGGSGIIYSPLGISTFNDNWQLKDVSILSPLPQLQTLDLRSNSVSDISFLQSLTQLQTLYLRSNSISDISFLQPLTQLKNLDLSDNKQIKDYSFLQPLTQLQTLDLRSNSISDISFLQPLTQLQTLDLRSNSISDISSLQSLTQLQTLDLSDNKQIKDYSFLQPLTQLQTLDLSDNKQIKDYSFLQLLTQLQILYLRSNSISDISFLQPLTQLQILYLSDNKQIKDYSFLQPLTQLQTLDLRSNSISDISFLQPLTQLQTLYLSDNKQIKNYSFLQPLTQLQTLDLSYNSISDISFLQPLTQLQTLDLRFNKQIKNYSFLQFLTQLQTLDLRYNSVSDISFLQPLTQLQTLALRSNSISDIEPLLPLIEKDIPLTIKENAFFGKISLFRNPITNPPIEVVKEGNQAILNYFKEKAAQGEVPLYEAKLLIIGQGGAGKTSLARRLQDPKAAMPKEKESTKGIDILYHHFMTPEGNDFRVNIWDFGGQEIYHATHQFFLTKRSLYVLLDDTRKDDKTVHDETFNYWLQVVELLSENSPVLIVQNEKADRSKQLDMKSIKGRFDNVLKEVPTNILTCRNLATVRKEIEHQVQQLPLVGQMLPKQWVAIRSALEALAKEKDYISLEQYFELCAAHKIPEEARALFLSSYLHDLGAFLHFRGDPILEDLFILNNTWATDAVYKVLDNEQVKARFGYFTYKDLEQIWKNKRYSRKRPQLLALMNKFQLCFELKDRPERTWLAPQLLPIETPDYDWNEQDNLMLRYRYGFMPKGLLSRFFVRMNRYVKNVDQAWRSGVFLHRENTDAFVRETYGSQEIVIRVQGAHPKELMTLIAEELDQLNDGYGEKLVVEKLIPCNCKDCQARKVPNYYDYSDLKRRRRKGKPTIECKVSYEDISVMSLLDGVFVEKAQMVQTAQDLATESSSGFKTVELFLASSNELKAERDRIEIFIRRENDRLARKGIYLKLNLWEDFISSMSRTRKQDDYNNKVRNSEICICLFATKVGDYTKEEFETAYDSFKKGGKTQHIFTFFKKSTFDTSNMNLEQLSKLAAFKKHLGEQGHYYDNFDNDKDLLFQLKSQLEKVLEL